ncbi:phage structural protein [Salibacterium halotolerans]|uniref:Phage tail tube protein n=1 Tax=Salibacterium halotolerans TaxID=1884432 RepID=A0A1I5NAL3_9BACI|nr:hypothetical protein [Salibacterium halotolerans]SFP18732.1 hypothetical protein SAMN05518683_10359 [Salibacterium halotolerans]
MAEVQTFNVKDVNTVIDGDFLSGYGEDTKVSIEKNNDEFSPFVDADGGVTYAEETNESAVMTVTLKPSSPSLPKMYRLKNNRSMFSAEVIDGNTGKYKAGGNNCRIQSIGSREFGKTPNGVEISIYIPKLNDEMEG